MGYINPYNFVPLPEDPPDRSSGHPGFLRSAKDMVDGRLVCELVTVTDLITLGKKNQSSAHLFCRNAAGRPIIRGTSLKGMVRAVHEALSNGCLWRAKISGDGYNYTLKDDWSNASCDSPASLCPTCRLFGTLSGTVGLRGRLSFTDAEITEGQLRTERRSLKVLSDPKPRHAPTYGLNGSKGDPIRGRKLYYHNRPGAQWHEKAHRHTNVTVEYAPQGTRFRFEVRLDNVTLAELPQLVAALELKGGMAHKLGLGKPIGLGSCTVSIMEGESSLYCPGERYGGEPGPGVNLARLRDEAAKVQVPPGLEEILRLNKPKEARNAGKEIGYPPNYRNYPQERIDARGVFGGKNDQPGRAEKTVAAFEKWPRAEIRYVLHEKSLRVSSEGSFAAPLAMDMQEIEQLWPELARRLKIERKVLMEVEVKRVESCYEVIGIGGRRRR